jgi:hypothetical protein
MILEGILEGEEILPEDHPIHWDYCYVCDGKVELSPLGGGATVRDWKRSDGFKEIRSCKMVERGFFKH